MDGKTESILSIASKKPSSRLSLRKRRRERNRLHTNQSGEQGGKSGNSRALAKSPNRKRSRGTIPLPTFTYFADDYEDKFTSKVKINSNSNLHDLEKENVGGQTPNSCANKALSVDRKRTVSKEDSKVVSTRTVQSNNKNCPKEQILEVQKSIEVTTKSNNVNATSNSNERDCICIDIVTSKRNDSNSKIDKSKQLKNTSKVKSTLKSNLRTTKKMMETPQLYGNDSRKKEENTRSSRSSANLNNNLSKAGCTTKTTQVNDIMDKAGFENVPKNLDHNMKCGKNEVKALSVPDHPNENQSSTKPSSKLRTTKSNPVESSSTSNSDTSKVLMEEQNEVICLYESPDFKDFQISRAQLLANEERKLERAHEDLIEKAQVKIISKSNVVEKKKKSQIQNIQQEYTLSTSHSSSQGIGILNSLEDKAINEEKNPLYKNTLLAKSDSEIERAMINRLARLEKSASYFNHLCIKVSRELKKHRNKIIKARIKRKQAGNLGKENKPQFLNDIHEDAVFQQENLHSSTKLPHSMVKKAVDKMYTFRRKCQPTLTQMLDNDDSSSCNDSVQGGEIHTDEVTSFDGNITVEEKKPMRNVKSLPVVEGAKEVEDDIDYKSKKDNVFESGTFVEYEVALSKGRERGLWGLSSATPSNFLEMNECATKVETSFHDDEHDWLNKNWSNESNNDIGDLVNMFIEEGSNSHHNAEEVDVGLSQQQQQQQHKKYEDSMPLQQSNLSQLSPRRQEACKSIIESVQNDEDTSKSIRGVCPTWEENMIFAFQQDPEEIKVALVNIEEMESRLDKVKEQFLQNMKCRKATLHLYKSALSKSLSLHV